MKKSRAPKHLGSEAKALWRAVVEAYDIDDAAGLAVLGQGCEALDLIRSCQEAIAADGVTVRDRWNQNKPHPCLAALRDARASFLAAFRALNLDLEPLKDLGRPGGR